MPFATKVPNHFVAIRMRLFSRLANIPPSGHGPLGDADAAGASRAYRAILVRETSRRHGDVLNVAVVMLSTWK